MIITLFNAWASGWAAAFSVACFTDGKITSGIICVCLSLAQMPCIAMNWRRK